MKAIPQRLFLTTIWIVFLCANLAVAEAYTRLKTPEGYVMLLPIDRSECWRAIFKFYFSYLGGIAAFWFTRPFTNPKTDKAANGRFVIALVFTVMLNSMLLFLTSREIWLRSVHTNLIEDFKSAAVAAGWASVLVGPVNAYYFGTKLKPAR